MGILVLGLCLLYLGIFQYLGSSHSSSSTESPPQDHDQVSDSSDDESDDELEESFSAVREAIKLDSLAKYASNIRKTCVYHPDDKGDFYAEEIGSPMYGSQHILYPIVFNDGVRWLLKVPSYGTRDKFSDQDARGIRSEALTMRLIKLKTTIPLPTVYAFSDTCDNDLNCPFILLEYLEGKPLYDIWFNKVEPENINHDKRTKCLRGLASAMIQLSQISSNLGGTLTPNDHDLDHEVGPLWRSDEQAILDRHFADESCWKPTSVEAGPFSDPKKYYTLFLDAEKEPHAESFERGIRKFLRLLLDWTPEPDSTNEYKPFVLAHPDFNFQNILVAEDGTVKGIIDWDGVGLVPRSIGNEAYPSWLTRDWDPAMYRWNEDMDRGIKKKGLWEDSPAALQRYRRIYADFIASHPESTSPEFNLTRKSLVCVNLFIAANSPLCRYDILGSIAEKIIAIVREEILPAMETCNADEREEDDSESESEEATIATWDVFDIAWALGDDELSERNLQLLKDGFQGLLKKEEAL